MISRWLICFSCLYGCALFAATVSGRVELRDSREPAVRKRQDFSGVVVSLDPLNPSALKAHTAAHARIVQKSKTFTPHVLAIQVGTTVDFPNFDPIFHNAFSNYGGQMFDVGLYPPGASRGVHFTREGVVRIFCNIHSTMSAVIVVLNSPYFAVTGRDGAFEIPNVRPGDYQLHVFHERATPATLAALTRTIAVTADPGPLAPIAVSESGYLPIPHRNKYGRDYGPTPDDNAIYPGVKR